MSLTSSKIRALNAVVEEGGFTAAARRLGVSQPAVTQHIRELQTEFEVALFEKRRGTVVPTPLCRQLYRITSEILRREDDALRLLRSRDEADFGPLRIGFGNAVPGMQLLAAFREKHPRVAVHIEMGPWAQIMEAIVTQRIDVGILPEVPQEVRFEKQVCARQRIVAIVHPDHPFAARGTISIADLVDQPLIFRTTEAHVQRTLDHVFAQTSAVPQPRLIADTREGVMEAVARNLGIGFQMEGGSTRTDGIRQVRIEELSEPTNEYAFHLANPPAPIVKAFMETVSEVGVIV